LRSETDAETAAATFIKPSDILISNNGIMPLVHRAAESFALVNNINADMLAGSSWEGLYGRRPNGTKWRNSAFADRLNEERADRPAPLLRDLRLVDETLLGRQAIVFGECGAEPVVWQRVDRISVDASHRLGCDHGVDDRFLGGRDDLMEKRSHCEVWEHGNVHSDWLS